MDPSVWPPSPASSEGQSKINRRVKHPPQMPTKVIFVIGAPGAGKGTICKQAAEKLGYYHLSAGDYLRDLANNPSDHPKEAYAGLNPIDLDQAMKRSKLIRSEQIIEILRFKLEKEHKAGWTKVIVDGFPRGVESAAAYEKLIGKPSMVMLVDCTKENAATRFLTRGREEGDTKGQYRLAIKIP